MSSAEDARVAGRLAITYMVAVAGEVLRATSLDFLDILIVTAISNFNRTAVPGTRRRAGLPADAPLGISRNAVSRALNIPLETVRRRVAALIGKHVLVEQADGLVFSSDNNVGLGNNAALADFNLERLRELFRGLRAAGIALD